MARAVDRESWLGQCPIVTSWGGLAKGLSALGGQLGSRFMRGVLGRGPEKGRWSSCRPGDYTQFVMHRSPAHISGSARTSGGAPFCRDDDRDWLVYDGRCPVCRHILDWVRRLDVRGRVRPLDLHTQFEEVRKRAPQLRREDLFEAVPVISADCRVRSGFSAVRRLAWHLPAMWSLLPALYAPGSSVLGPKVYAWTARNRYRLMSLGGVKACSPDGACSMPTSSADGAPGSSGDE